jgi:hypothetical protein
LSDDDGSKATKNGRAVREEEDFGTKEDDEIEEIPARRTRLLFLSLILLT